MPQTVLLTGGTGTIGRRLTQLLKEKGYAVSLLSRSSKPIEGVTVYGWDIPKGQIDSKAIETADYIIHLAGAGIADERWTDARKREIMDSRTQSTKLLADALATHSHHVKAFVSSSAIGYYGADTGDRPMVESSPAGSDFMAQVVRAWEQSVDEVTKLRIRTVKIRTGVVLTMEGGALPKLVQPIRLGAGAPLGSGQQYMSWIHIDDICRMFIQALEDETWRGAFNGVAPEPVTNEGLTRAIAGVLHKPLLLPKVPSFALRLLFGEMAIAVLGSSLVLNKRIQQETLFTYHFPKLTDALLDLLR